jgi:hypothetical protein
MTVTLTSTTRLISIETPVGVVPARVWEGRTESGIECFALITRIAVHKDDDASQFDRELQEQIPPSPRAVQVFDPRLVL